MKLRSRDRIFWKTGSARHTIYRQKWMKKKMEKSIKKNTMKKNNMKKQTRKRSHHKLNNHLVTIEKEDPFHPRFNKYK